MRSARLLPCLLVAVALAGACALPSRDNIYDPDGAPTLKVAVLPDAAGCTPGSAPLSEWQAVSAASRGACIGLDARSAGANAAIRFFYVGPNGAQVELTPGNGIAFLATAGLAVIDDAPLRSLPAGAIARFRADIHRGGHHVVDATLALTNEAPVAIGDPPRHIPIGGYAWAPASAVDVTFSGALSVDPDHDPLRYRWVFSDGAVLVSAPGQSTVTRPVATSPARHLRALLIASDGLLASRPTAVDVEIGNPAVWSGGAIGSFSPIVHLDEIHATYPLPPLGPPKVYLRPAGVAHLEGGPIPLLVVLPINGFSVAQLNLFRFPYGEPLGSPLFGSGASGALRAAAGGTGVWLYEEDVPTLSRYDLDSGGTALVSPASVTDNLPAINGTNVSPLLEVDSTGAAWFSLVNSTALGHSAASGVSMLSTSAGHLVTAMAARPGSSELWELDNARLPTTAPAATLAAWDSTDDHVRRFALGPEFATALSWLDPSTLWIARVGDGVRVLDTDILETTGNVDLATLVHYPMSDHIDALVADPSTGDAWAHTTNLNLLRLGRFGEVSLYPEDTTPLFADDDGSIWFADATQAPGRGHTVTSDGALFRVPVSSLLSYANVDDEDGSVWVFSTDDRTLRHWATDGTLLGEIGTVAAPAGNPPAAIPPLDFLRFEPGGAALWAHAFPDGLLRYAVNGTAMTPSPGLVLSSAALAISNDPLTDAETIVPSAPIPASTPFAWVYRQSLLTKKNSYSTILPSGTINDVAFTSTSEEFALHMEALSPATNRICGATMASGGVFRARWVDSTTGILKTMGPYSLGNDQLVSVAVGHNSLTGAEVCWALLQLQSLDTCASPDTAILVGWDTAGNIVRITSQSVGFLSGASGSGVGMSAQSDDTVWFAAHVCTPVERDAFVRLDYDPATGAYTFQQLPAAPNAYFAPR